MSLPAWFRKMTIFPKLLLTLLLAVVPMYAVSIYINEQGADGLREEMSLSMSDRIDFYLQMLEADIALTMRLQLQYVNDDDIQKLANASSIMSNYEIYLAQERVQEKMRLMTEAGQYVADASTFIPSLGRTVRTNIMDDPLPEEEAARLIDAYRHAGGPIMELDGELLLATVYPHPLYSSASSFMIEAKLSKPKLTSFLDRLSEREKGGAVLMDGGERWALSTVDGERTTQAMIEFVRNLRESDDEAGQRLLEVDGQNYLVSFEKSDVLEAVLLVYTPERQFLGQLEKYRNWFWVLSVGSVLLIAFVSHRVYKIIHEPVKRMVAAFRKVEKGDMNLSIRHGAEDEFGYLYSQFNVMIGQLRTLIQQVYEGRIRQQRSELKQLQSQINPHFLYNSYFLVYRMAQNGDTDAVARAAEYLGEYFRYVTRNSEDAVPLEREYRHMINYNDIQRMRLGRRIDSRIDEWDASLPNIHVPRLILQPLLENAYHHGLKDKVTDGLIRVSIRRTDGELTIRVEDNGDALSEAKLDELRGMLAHRDADFETTGMFNVHLRLRLEFGDPYGLRLSRSELGGFCVELTVPIRGEGENTHV
ncbi:sensor histidine kinase [Paenibacillus sp.]|uniref:sensor histidine kinase n=1 Tax=Paenibacillus sp. TaxID=58172 RepID=UPI002D6426E8|nr:histidine kinase [Paenibacillus sp.]HZG85345.1 histidine kinase [Paenibacillus sp.]